MGRKNRKGRSPKQNPRRFYRAKKQDGGGRQRRRQADLPAEPDSSDSLTGGWTRRRSGARDAVREARQRAARQDGDRGGDRGADRGPLWFVDAAGVRGLPHPAGPRHEPPRTRVRAMECGNCREFVPAADPLSGGRGRCLHPASGISRPPSEYPGCDYFA